MKKFLLVLLLATLSFFIFLGISQARQCIYLLSSEGKNYYYDPSKAEYSGDIVSFFVYDNDACKLELYTTLFEIDCARKMSRYYDLAGLSSEWESISPGSVYETLRIKLCR